MLAFQSYAICYLMITDSRREFVANEDSDSESEDDTDMSESEEESDSETTGLDLDVCPHGCDQGLYDNTCLLREKRLDVEELLAEEQLNKETVIKELDTMHKRAKLIESAMKTVEQELEAFQVGAISAFEIFVWFSFSSNAKVFKIDKEQGRFYVGAGGTCPPDSLAPPRFKS